MSQLTNAGDGTFTGSFDYPVQGSPTAVLLADFNNDLTLDMAAVNEDSSSITVYLNGECCGAYTGGYTGNANCDTEGKYNLSDITRLISRVYLDPGVPLCCEANGDVNCDTKMNLSDITNLITKVYLDQDFELCACP